MDHIFRAIEADDREAVEQLLVADPARVASTTDLGNTPLHEAVRFSRPEIAAMLLAAKADPNARGESENTPLHLAVERDALPELVDLLHRNGADLEAVNALGETPLYKAALGNPDVAETLLRYGARLDTNSAILLRRADQVRQLLEDDPLSSHALFSGQLLLNAVQVRSKELVQLLLRHGITPDDYSLFLALQQALNDPSEELEILRLLLGAGANLSAKDSYGNTILEFVRRWDVDRSQPVINLLREYGATA